MFVDKFPVDTGDACPTVYEGLGVDGFHRVQRNDKLDWNLHSRRGFYKYICTQDGRKSLHQETLSIQKSKGLKEIFRTTSSFSSSSISSSLESPSLLTFCTLGFPF